MPRTTSTDCRLIATSENPRPSAPRGLRGAIVTNLPDGDCLSQLGLNSAAGGRVLLEPSYGLCTLNPVARWLSRTLYRLSLGVVGETLPVDDHARLITDDPRVVSGSHR